MRFHSLANSIMLVFTAYVLQIPLLISGYRGLRESRSVYEDNRYQPRSWLIGGLVS